jgi:ubiquinone biosynthesis protein
VDSHPIRFLRNLGRSSEIATVLLNYGFGDLIERTGLRRSLQWGWRLLWFKRAEARPGLTTAQRIRLALQDLGPTFVKFGQVISTRPDLLPADLIEELSLLQENVRQFPGLQAIEAIEHEFGRPISQLYTSFEIEPVAAGSLGQVHRAVTLDGTVVAVKVRRPNVVHDVERDISLLAELAILLEYHIAETQVFDPVGLVNQFARTIRREMNFRREGRSADEFRRLFRHDATLKIPRIYDELTSEAVLTMEFIDGARADDIDAMRAFGVRPATIARNGACIFMKQAFDLGVFHGDPHPGNMRILNDGTIALIDFGMVGTLDENKREQLVDLFVAVVKNDVRRAVTMVKLIGQPSRPIDDALLCADVKDFVESYYGLPLEQVKVGRMLSHFVHILAEHGLRCPGDMMLLVRAIITLEGVGRSLDPQFNLAAELAPFVERVVKQRYEPKRMMHRAYDDIRSLVAAAHNLPLSASRVLEKLAQDDLKIQFEHRGLDRLITEFDRSSNRVVISVVIASLILSSAIVFRTTSASPWLTVPVFALSGFLGIWLIYGVLRSGRL